jgi:hypothetical protein
VGSAPVHDGTTDRAWRPRHRANVVGVEGRGGKWSRKMARIEVR